MRPLVAERAAVQFQLEAAVIEIVLVRHAPARLGAAAAARSTTRRSPRTAAPQAEALAAALAGERFDACYTSTLQRAIETAEPIGARLGVRFERCSWLDELRLPTLEGRTAEEVEHFFAQRPRPRPREVVGRHAAGGE